MKHRAKEEEEEEEEEEEKRLVQILGGYGIAMNDRRTRSTLSVVAVKGVFGCILVLVFIVGFSFSNLPLRGIFRQRLVSSWRTPGLESISGDSSVVSITETVLFPDQALIFLKYPQPTPLFAKDDIDCVYFSPNSSQPHLNLQPDSIDGEDPDFQIVRCPLQPHSVTTSVGIKSNGNLISIGSIYHWDSLVYEALINSDNTTVVFVKGLNLPPKKVVDPSRFECVYGRDFTTSNLLQLAEVIAIGQEIVRCRTPLSILSGSHSVNSSIKVSVRGVDKLVMSSVA
ncbi:hypothetical protein Vadar_034786 [Vaccinium darrowii]|uniref:Uncharacterized protein n=1 Tax=Vaccinium darrowii TaxID=229202 RepID=A0ACB7Y564_9ERIC|nr:hypothetical protein Vadar_034786 [Vaccinium darrowii]